MKTKIKNSRSDAIDLKIGRLKRHLLSMVLLGGLLTLGDTGFANSLDDVTEQADEEEQGQSMDPEDGLNSENWALPNLNSCQRLDWTYDKPRPLPPSPSATIEKSLIPADESAMNMAYYPGNPGFFPGYPGYPGNPGFPYPFPYPAPRQPVYTWYCQARPVGDSKFEFTQFHSYDQNRLNARTFALSRCWEDYDRCTARCALAPRVCEPHFWP